MPASGNRLARDAAAGAASLIDSRGRRPYLLALLAVDRHLQRPAASQHDGVGLMDRLIGGRIKIVVVTDGEAVFPHHVEYPRLHRRHCLRQAVDGKRDVLVHRDAVAAGEGQCQ
jgi:hypothetical protein